jgi:drug/metabolite transporter (DMT)-like permease
LGAFAVIYLVWGSTYLGILWAIETMPPMLMAGARFLTAGGILWLLARPKPGEPTRPTRRDWAWAVVLGFLMLLLGNGLLSIAESEMPTGVAALLIATVPLWMVVLEALHLRKVPRPLVAVGLALGFAGVALLATSKDGWASGAVNFAFVAGVLVGSLAWAMGSLVSRRSPIRLPLLRSVALQMLCGGALMLALGLALGEHRGFDLAAITLRSAAAWLYLVTFGSVLAFTAYSWVLRQVPAAVAGTYAFVNPIVAVAIGALVLQEPFGLRTALAGVLVVAAVMAITYSKAKAAPA